VGIDLSTTFIYLCIKTYMWFYKDEEVNFISDMPEGVVGYVYIITNLTKGKQYVGKKLLYSEQRKKLTQKELKEITDKRKSKYKQVIKESNWREYTGSSKELNEDIKNGDKIFKEILHYCFSKRELTYREENYQHKLDVLEDENYYNSNIGSSFYKMLKNDKEI
jgi:hypothetical protein